MKPPHKTKNYELRIQICVTDIATEREAEPPIMYYEGELDEVCAEAIDLICECYNDLNDPEWCKEYDEM
jgi:hypothetical protein